jgi:hypothetical protein
VRRALAPGGGGNGGGRLGAGARSEARAFIRGSARPWVTRGDEVVTAEIPRRAMALGRRAYGGAPAWTRRA